MHHGDRGPLFLPVLQPQQQGCIIMCSKLCGIQGSRSHYPTGGGLAQLGEHYVRNVGVAGSTPVPSTKHPPTSHISLDHPKEINFDEVLRKKTDFRSYVTAFNFSGYNRSSEF